MLDLRLRGDGLKIWLGFESMLQVSHEIVVQLDQRQLIDWTELSDQLRGDRAGAGADFEDLARNFFLTVFSSAWVRCGVRIDKSAECTCQSAAAGEHRTCRMVATEELPQKNLILAEPTH